MNFLKKIVGIYKIYKGARLVEESWSLLALGEVDKSSNLFKKGERLLGRLPLNILIMRGVIEFRLRDRYKCLNTLSNAWKLIDESKSLKTPDKLYLKEYIYSMIDVYHKHTDLDVSLFYPVHVSDVPYDNVSKTLKKTFPNKR